MGWIKNISQEKYTTRQTRRIKNILKNLVTQNLDTYKRKLKKKDKTMTTL